LQELKNRYGFNLLEKESKTIQKYLKLSAIEIRDDRLILTPSGKFIADQVTSDLFQLESD
jgi:coproporphyrinogen III oxidase-like Fe-S oxidoreductase